MARQPRTARAPYRTGPSQPHGPQRPQRPPGPIGRPLGLGSRAFGAARAGGNILKEMFLSLADFIAKLLRRIFGKVLSSDLEQQRNEKRAAVDREKETLDRLKAETSDLERDLARERDSRGDKGRGAQDERRNPHADLLNAAKALTEGKAGGRRDPNYKVTPAGPFWDTLTLPAGGTAAGALAMGGGAGVAAAALGRDGEWFRALEAVSAGKLAPGQLSRFDILEQLHKGEPYSRESMEAAVARIREVLSSEAVEAGDSSMFDMLTCVGYIEAGLENARVKMQGPQTPELAEGDVEARVKQIVTEVMAHGATPDKWSVALAAKAGLSVKEVEKRLHPDYGRAIGHEAEEGGQDKGPGGRRYGLSGPGG